MRHRKSGRKLNRNSSHRKAMFRNMACSLFEHELIKTTVPKAKELRRKAEPLITLAKEDSVANRRLAFARLRDRDVVTKLFNELGPRYELRLRSDAVFCVGGEADTGTGRGTGNGIFWRKRELPTSSSSGVIAGTYNRMG